LSSEDLNLIKTLCSIHAPSGNELLMKQFILDYIEQNNRGWNSKPEIFSGEDFQDCIVVAFGKPRTAVFVHMDSIGFTARYNNEIIPIGGPDVEEGYILTGKDSKGKIEGPLKIDEQHRKLSIDFERIIDPGTELTFKPFFKDTYTSLECCYLDNRLGVYVALKLFETIENGLFIFSCWEEHGGGSVPYLAKFIYEKYKVKQALIADITWVTEGVHPGEGVVISLRDKSIPRRSYVDKIIEIARKKNIKYQLEVEASGGSDGKELQASPYPFDWCFIGAAEDNVHSPKETVDKKDLLSMIEIYNVLLEEL